MEIYGRKMLDYDTKIAVDFDDLVFKLGHNEIVVSLYRARVGDVGDRVEIRSSNGLILVHPRAANVIEVSLDGTASGS